MKGSVALASITHLMTSVSRGVGRCCLLRPVCSTLLPGPTRLLGQQEEAFVRHCVTPTAHMLLSCVCPSLTLGLSVQGLCWRTCGTAIKKEQGLQTQLQKGDTV